MRGFRAGLRCRSPLVLLAAAGLLVPVLLLLQWVFASGAWSKVPLEYWLAADGRDNANRYVAWTVGRLKADPPDRPVLVLLGGSTAREATVDGGTSLAALVRREGGPSLSGWNLATSLQTYAENLAIIDNLPGTTPTTVVIGVSPGRFTSDFVAAARQLEGRGLMLWSDSLSRYLDREYSLGNRGFKVLPGALGMVANNAAAQARMLAKGQLAVGSYTQHHLDDGPVKSEKAKRGVLMNWWRVRHPQFRENVGFNMAMLDELVRRGRQRGFGVVLVELPRNMELIGTLWDGVDRTYRPRVRAIAGRYGIAYLDFNRGLGLSSADFFDYGHMRHSGRVVWEARLARELARLYGPRPMVEGT